MSRESYGFDGYVTLPTQWVNKDGETKIRMRNYEFFTKNGSMVTVKDGVTPFMAYLAKTFPKEFTKALGSVGWWLRKRIQEAAYSENPPHAHWPALSDIQQLRTLDDLKRERLGKKLRDPATHAFGALVKAVGYKRDKALMRVRVGFLSQDAAAKAARLQAGFSTKVTDKTRRFFAAAGLGIPKGETIETEGRALIQPVFEASKKEIGVRIETKISEYLGRSERRYSRAA
jgi:hypothetical protein